MLSIRQTVPVADLPITQGESLNELWRLLRDEGCTPSGPPFVRYHAFNDVQTDVEVGVPVDGDVNGRGRIVRGELPGGRAVTTVHLGSHDRLGEAYGRLADGVAAHGGADGPAWEVYEWINPTREPDPQSWPAPADWRTLLVQPIK
jgi:effector-binding domain-containing protein